jgi:hypothetical protein
LKDCLVGGHESRAGFVARAAAAGKLTDYRDHYSREVLLVKDNFKWFGWREIDRQIRILHPDPIGAGAGHGEHRVH